MRPEGWDRRLWAYIDAARKQRFEWGKLDCATWAADWRCILTGHDAAQAWRGRYKTELGAWRIIRRAGFRTLDAWFDSIAGQRMPAPLMAQRGDIAMARGALGIVVGAQVAVLAPEGLLFVPITDAVAAWRVE